MELFGNIGMGDFGARAEIVSRDELGTMAVSLNAMLDNTLVLIQSREERDAIQTSILKLLEEISGLAEGRFDQTGRSDRRDDRCYCRLLQCHGGTAQRCCPEC